MGLLGRRRTDARAGIEDFWVWWPAGRERVLAAIDTGAWPDDLVEEIGARVGAIDPGLRWEFAAGARARHVLIVSAGGDPRQRAVAERWCRLAPPVDGMWEYHTTRQPSPGALTSTVDFGTARLDLGLLVFAAAVDTDHREVDVVVHHPGFAGLPEQVRHQVAFLALDWLLGEVAVEMWVGAVRTAVERPEPATGPVALKSIVDDLALDTGEDSWAMLSSPDGRRLSMIRQPLKPVRWPRFDQHITVTLPYLSTSDSGLPVDPSLSALREFEDGVERLLGPDAVLVGHESGNRRRCLHVRADADSRAAGVLRHAATRWPEGRASVSVMADPAWERVRALTGG
jgi:Family of unknown function (DUF695)